MQEEVDSFLRVNQRFESQRSISQDSHQLEDKTCTFCTQNCVLLFTYATAVFSPRWSSRFAVINITICRRVCRIRPVGSDSKGRASSEFKIRCFEGVVISNSKGWVQMGYLCREFQGCWRVLWNTLARISLQSRSCSGVLSTCPSTGRGAISWCGVTRMGPSRPCPSSQSVLDGAATDGTPLPRVPVRSDGSSAEHPQHPSARTICFSETEEGDLCKSGHFESSVKGSCVLRCVYWLERERQLYQKG